MTTAAASDPFESTANPAHYVPRPASDAVLEELERRVRDSAHPVALTGPVGLGKTFLMQVLADRLAGSFRVVWLPYPALSASEVCRWVLDALGQPAGDDPEGALLDCAFRTAGDREILLLIDDASALPLSTARHLATLVSASGGALRAVFAGVDDARLGAVIGALGPDLHEIRFETPMTADQTAAYVRARLSRGGDAERARRFDADTVARIHGAAAGIPRRVHELASLVWRMEGEGEVGPVIERWARDDQGAAGEPPADRIELDESEILEPGGPTARDPGEAAALAAAADLEADAGGDARETPPPAPERPEARETPPPAPERPEARETPPPAPERPEARETPPPAPERPEARETPPPAPERPEARETPPPAPERPEARETPPPAPERPEARETPPPAPERPEARETPPPAPERPEARETPPPAPERPEARETPPPAPKPSRAPAPPRSRRERAARDATPMPVVPRRDRRRSRTRTAWLAVASLGVLAVAMPYLLERIEALLPEAPERPRVRVGPAAVPPEPEKELDRGVATRASVPPLAPREPDASDPFALAPPEIETTDSGLAGSLEIEATESLVVPGQPREPAASANAPTDPAGESLGTDSLAVEPLAPEAQEPAAAVAERPPPPPRPEPSAAPGEPAPPPPAPERAAAPEPAPSQIAEPAPVRPPSPSRTPPSPAPVAVARPEPPPEPVSPDPEPRASELAAQVEPTEPRPEPQAEPKLEPEAELEPAPEEEPEPPPVAKAPSPRPPPAPRAAAPPPVRRAAQPEPVLVNVHAIPWATIHVDGGVVGETPLVALPLSPGLHVFRAEFPGGRAVVRTVEISSENRTVSFE